MKTTAEDNYTLMQRNKHKVKERLKLGERRVGLDRWNELKEEDTIIFFSKHIPSCAGSDTDSQSHKPFSIVKNEGFISLIKLGSTVLLLAVSFCEMHDMLVFYLMRICACTSV